MTFLSKLGSVLARGLAIVTGIWPVASGFFGSSTKAQQTGTTIINDLNSIGQVVVQAEALIQQPGSGAQKLAAATPLVANIVKTSELVSGHQIKDEALFTEGCTDVTSGVAKILNSLSADGVKTAGGPAVTADPPPAKTVTATG